MALVVLGLVLMVRLWRLASMSDAFLRARRADAFACGRVQVVARGRSRGRTVFAVFAVAVVAIHAVAALYAWSFYAADSRIFSSGSS